MGIEADVLTAQNLMLWEAGMAPSPLLLLFALKLMQFRNRARTTGQMAARESLWISQNCRNPLLTFLPALGILLGL
jgi:hypothetical protein